MFKRVSKQVNKKAKQEELGALEEIGPIIDSDSEESSNSENEDLSSPEITKSGKGTGKSNRKPSRKKNVEDEDEVTSDASSSVQEQVEESSMTVKDALKSPMLESECVICPGKVMKNPHMEKVHLESAVCLPLFHEYYYLM
jgi:hypothetical protein